MIIKPRIPLKAAIFIFAIGAGVGAVSLYQWAVFKNAQKRRPWPIRVFYYLTRN